MKKNEPLVGASIVIKGSNMGVLTDIDGHYTLNLPKEAKTLSLSFVGFQTKEIEINDTTRFSTSLEQGLVLQELKITGFL